MRKEGKRFFFLSNDNKSNEDQYRKSEKQSDMPRDADNRDKEAKAEKNNIKRKEKDNKHKPKHSKRLPSFFIFFFYFNMKGKTERKTKGKGFLPALLVFCFFLFDGKERRKKTGTKFPVYFLFPSLSAAKKQKEKAEEKIPSAF